MFFTFYYRCSNIQAAPKTVSHFITGCILNEQVATVVGQTVRPVVIEMIEPNAEDSEEEEDDMQPLIDHQPNAPNPVITEDKETQTEITKIPEQEEGDHTEQDQAEPDTEPKSPVQSTADGKLMVEEEGPDDDDKSCVLKTLPRDILDEDHDDEETEIKRPPPNRAALPSNKTSNELEQMTNDSNPKPSYSEAQLEEHLNAAREGEEQELEGATGGNI
jgi:hypothetical protein